MDTIIVVDNIKCKGCAASIRNGLQKIPGVLTVEVDLDEGSVLITADRPVRKEAIQALQGMGYPERGSLQGLPALGAKAKSFVSCAVGRLDKEG